jgi:hypothetical protein
MGTSQVTTNEIIFTKKHVQQDSLQKNDTQFYRVFKKKNANPASILLLSPNLGGERTLLLITATYTRPW